MVNHWFGGKDGLFAAAAELPVRADDVVPHVVLGPRQQVGGRLLRTFLAIADRHPAQLAILVRNMHSNELAEQALRSLVDDTVLWPVIVALDADEPCLRTALCSVQLIGLAVARFATRPNGIVELEVDDLVAAMAPTLQRYLIGAVRSTDGPT